MHVRYREKVFSLVGLDLAAMLLAFVLGIVFGHRPPVHAGLLIYYRWGIYTLLLVTLAVFVIFDVYSLHHVPTRFMNQVILIGIALVTSAGMTTFIFFFFRNDVPRAVFILFYVFSLSIMTLFRYFFSLFTLSRIYWKVLLVGNQGPCAEIATMIRERPYLHSRVVGFLSDDSPQAQCSGLPFLGTTEHLPEKAVREGVDQIIVAMSKTGERLIGDLMECMKRRIKVADFRQVIEQVSGKVPIEFLNDTWFIEEISSSDKRYFWIVKRMLDILFSFGGLCIALPLLPLVVTLIRLDSAGPAFYSQQRVGRRGKVFRVWKLRTMVQDADQASVHWTLEQDERITRCGRLLRKLRIDEVPQLYNVLKGDMSLIGPRPEALSLVEKYRAGISYYMERSMVTPGITGWAQINYPYGNSLDDTKEKLKYDFFYIKNRSIALDILILLRTIRTVLTGKGAL